mmetsp:Transcript_3681/g.8527  ORF Transcript_3681/g.8527 Transcript_3681/m.8527 type:complete len:540 (+) Transcript_3681:134-1753(+)
MSADQADAAIDAVDLSNLRGTKAPRTTAGQAAAAAADRGGGKASPQAGGAGAGADAKEEEDLENLAELVPGLRSKQDGIVHPTTTAAASDDRALHADSAAAPAEPKEGDDTLGSLPQTTPPPEKNQRTAKMAEIRNIDSMLVMGSRDGDDDDGEEKEVEEGGDANGEAVATTSAAMGRMQDVLGQQRPEGASSDSDSDSSMETMQNDNNDDNAADEGDDAEGEEIELKGFEDSSGAGNDPKTPSSSQVNNDSSHALGPALTDDDNGDEGDRKPSAAIHHEYGSPLPDQRGKEPSMPGGMLVGSSEYNQPAGHMSSNASLSTATQTQAHGEVRMPMYLPTFKPATGCTNASDFIVRCFVARLRSGITVVKHGRSRWCKSRLRILHVHTDGRSLSWKPALGEPSSSKRPPKLDLSTCTEVRHAWSPDPLNPMYTGTPILRQKCEAANAHKSFALIFPKRTVDITAITADQCKVLMEGFSALCFRLQVANLASRGKRPDGTDDDRQTIKSDTVSNTNTSMTNVNPTTSPTGEDGRRRNKSRR